MIPKSATYQQPTPEIVVPPELPRSFSDPSESKQFSSRSVTPPTDISAPTQWRMAKRFGLEISPKKNVPTMKELLDSTGNTLVPMQDGALTSKELQRNIRQTRKAVRSDSKKKFHQTTLEELTARATARGISHDLAELGAKIAMYTVMAKADDSEREGLSEEPLESPESLSPSPSHRRFSDFFTKSMSSLSPISSGSSRRGSVVSPLPSPGLSEKDSAYLSVSQELPGEKNIVGKKMGILTDITTKSAFLTNGIAPLTRRVRGELVQLQIKNTDLIEKLTQAFKPVGKEPIANDGILILNQLTATQNTELKRMADLFGRLKSQHEVDRTITSSLNTLKSQYVIQPPSPTLPADFSAERQETLRLQKQSALREKIRASTNAEKKRIKSELKNPDGPLRELEQLLAISEKKLGILEEELQVQLNEKNNETGESKVINEKQNEIENTQNKIKNTKDEIRKTEEKITQTRDELPSRIEHLEKLLDMIEEKEVTEKSKQKLKHEIAKLNHRLRGPLQGESGEEIVKQKNQLEDQLQELGSDSENEDDDDILFMA